MNSNDKIVVLGMFDGVHLGHAQLFSMARKLKTQYDCAIIVYTFRNHPDEFLTGKSVRFILNSTERIARMKALGADEVIADIFDSDICNMSAQDFGRMLIERFHATHVVVGFNYTFGAHGSGDAKELSSLGKKLGFNVYVAAPVMYQGEAISSSRIRHAITQGDIYSANIMLGSSYTMSGDVERCRQVGRKMGFPTANIRNKDNKPIPLFGVYATHTRIGENTYESITNVGTNPTFGDMALSVETHIFDFDSNIYDEYITVEFIDFVRKQQRFASISDLSAQINSDCDTVKSILAQQNSSMN